jgi:HAD superfamily hydrolase (TIGR01662 family)
MGQLLDGVEAVIFDVGNTLVFPDWDRIIDLAGQFCSIEQKATDLHARFNGILCSADGDERFLQMLSSRDVASGWHFRLLFNQLGVNEGNVAEIWRALEGSHLDRHLWAQVNPDARGVLDSLRKRGYRLAAISNTEDGRIANLLEETGLAEFLLFNLDSFVEGVAKPDPQIFERALERLDVAPAQALFVGDSLKQDVYGAQASGLRAVLFDPDNLRPSAPVDRITRLTELLQ